LRDLMARRGATPEFAGARSPTEAGPVDVVPKRLREAAERAAWLWQQGQTEAALAAQRHVVDGLAEAIGPQSEATLWARLGLAQWLTDAAQARLADGRALVALRQDVSRRGTGVIDIDGFEAGLVAAFAEASGLLAGLISEAEEALGRDHEVAGRARGLLESINDRDVPELASRMAAEAIDQLLDQARRQIVSRLRAVSRRQARKVAANALPSRRRQVEAAVAERGGDDPETLRDQYRLVWDLAGVGDGDAAWALAEAVLEGRQRLLGEQHTDTVRSRYALACLRGDRDEFDSAIADLDGIIADFTSIDGPGHATTLTARRVQADFVGYQGDYRRAARLAAEVLHDAQDLGADPTVIDEAEAAAALWLRLA